MGKQAPWGQPAVYSATPPTLSDGDGSALQVDSAGNLKVSGEITGSDIELGAVEIKNSTDDTRATVGANGLAVDVKAVVPGTAATNLGKAEDAGHTSGDIGVMALGVRNDTATALATTTLDYIPMTTDANGAQWVTLATLIAGEDLTNNVQKVEQRFTYTAVVVADSAVKSGAGFLHTITISCNDAAPTAGSLIIYDNTAESGTIIFNHTFTTTPFVPFSVLIDATFATGLYLGFTTTGDVNASVSYR